MINIINIINKRTMGSLFHYAHFICDCLYPEIINEIYKYEKVMRIKNIDQTLGNFVKLYEEIMKNNSIEIVEDDFYKLNVTPVILNPKESYEDFQYMNIFREYIFNRYNINHSVYIENYPEVILIKRGERIRLIDDDSLNSINTNITTGNERREIKEREMLEEYLKNKYSDKFKAIFLEEKTFEEQVKLFNNSKLIIMAHGACMSNMFFCKPGTTIIEVICNKSWDFFDVISNNLQLNHIKIEINEPGHIINIMSTV
jgi:hypothetical protein